MYEKINLLAGILSRYRHGLHLAIAREFQGCGFRQAGRS